MKTPTSIQDALEIVRQDPQLDEPEHARLKAAMLERFGRSLELASVG